MAKLSKAESAVSRVLNQLRHGRRLRSLITRGSQLNLHYLAYQHANPTRAFLKNLLRMDALAVPIERIVIPESLSEFQNRDLLKQLGRPRILFDLVQGGVLDLRRAGLKSKPGYRDLTREFEEYQTLEKLRDSFQGNNLEILRSDPEISNLTLYYNLWMVRVLLYRAGEQKSAANKEGNFTALAEAKDVMAKLGGFLEELCAHFPVRKPQYQAWMIKAAGLIRDFNNPAADLVLTTVTERLEKQIENQEITRVRRERRSRKRRPKNIIEEELVHLAQRRYKISFSPEGTWLIPEGGFRRVGPALQRQVISHRVDPEKVVRREQHKLDEISQRIAVNADFRSMLEGFARILRSPNPIDHDQVISAIAGSCAAYEQGKVRPKLKIKLTLKVALELVKTSELFENKEAQKRLRKFAGTMLDMAARQLGILNGNLGVQLRRIAAKQRLQMEIIAQNMVRDANLRTFSEAVLRSITNRKIMNSAGRAGAMRQLAVAAKQTLLIKDETEEGIKRSAERVKHIVNLFAKVRRLINEKDKFRNAISNARKRYAVEAKHLRAGGNEDKLSDLTLQAVEIARENLKSLAGHNEEIAFTLAEIAREALLIQYDLAHKHSEENTEEQFEFLADHQSVFSGISELNRGYSMTYGAQGEELGLAHGFDIWRLKLRTSSNTR